MTVDLEELRQKKAFEELMAEKGNQEEATTAFLVVQDLNGQWTALSDFANKDYTLTRNANLDDFISGCANVQAGASIQQTAISVVMLMEQRAQQMQQHIMQQQEANRTASLIDPSKLRSPNA